MNKTLDVSMELSKNEIVDSINKICEKHNLPICLLNIIISNIAIEVNSMTQYQLQNNMNKYIEESKKETEKRGDR